MDVQTTHISITLLLTIDVVQMELSTSTDETIDIALITLPSSAAPRSR